MSAETSRQSPTSRLTGTRPPSTSGRTCSIAIGRRSFTRPIREPLREPPGEPPGSPPAVHQIGFLVLEDAPEALPGLDHRRRGTGARLDDQRGGAAEIERRERL